MPILKVENLKIYYRTGQGKSRAVDGVSFNVEEGKSLGLVGESGCGKTTTVHGIIQVMAKNAEIVEGSIVFKGRDILKMSRKEVRNLQWRGISLIPQAAMNSLNPVNKVDRAFQEILRLKLGMDKSKVDKRVCELFDLVGLDPERRKQYPHEFSGGMKQRVIIALALAMNPGLIIADEPVTALDVIVQNQVLRELKSLREKLGISLIMITHDISVIAQTCDTVAVMYAGKIVEKGPVEKVLLNPAHPYTMGLNNAFPHLGATDSTLISIEGSPPDLVDPPNGCLFAPRCPFVHDVCLGEMPALEELEKEHFSACYFSTKAEVLRKKAKEVGTWEKVNR